MTAEERRWLLSTLPGRHRRILALMAEGWEYREIGATVGLTYKTLRNYILEIFQTLAVRNRTEAVLIFHNIPFYRYRELAD